MNLKQLCDNLKGIIRAGNFISDNERIQDRQLEYVINYVRAEMIRQSYTKGGKINPDIEQDLGCVEMELADPAECCAISTNCSQALRTKLILPKAIEINNGNTLITYVGSVDKLQSIQIIDSERLQFQKYSKYTGKGSFAYKMNGRIYITNNKFLQYI